MEQVLETQGLVIKEEQVEDAKDIYTYLGCDPNITRYTGWNPYTSLEATIDKINHDLQDTTSYSWVIRQEEHFIGTIGAYDYNEEEASIEIGYSIAYPYWQKGYATIVVKEVITYLLNKTNIKSIRAWSHKDNIGSIKVLEHNGFIQIHNVEDTASTQIFYEKRQ